MKCEICTESEATVHLTLVMQTTEQKSRKLDLCESCAKAHGVNNPTGFSMKKLLELVEKARREHRD